MEVRTALGALALAGLLASAGAAAAEDCWGQPDPGTMKLVLVAEQVKAAEGKIVFTVYPDNKNKFLASKGKLARLRLPAKAPSTTACFWLPQGYYAVALYHDANGNEDFDRKITGMPAEGYAFSNNAPTNFGLPKFDAVRFKFDGAAPVRMRMRY